jgi:phage tail-like protein
MRVEGLAASADLIGRRVRLRWTFTPEGTETIADVPSVTLRRKRRDFAFPAPGPGDPYLLYDSTAFPPPPVPGTLIVADLPDRDFLDGPLRIRERTTTVVEVIGGRNQEVLRRVVRVVYGPDRTAMRQEIELLDVGGLGTTLQPGETYYYELDSPILPPDTDRALFHVTAMPGEVHGLGRQLYQMIPEMYRRNDTVARVPDPATGLLPEAAAGPSGGGQLRRMTDVYGASLDAMRSSAEGLWSLHDAAKVDPKFLPLLANWIGWDLTTAAEVSSQRNEIVNAPRLYESVGTIPGLRTIVDHYTGWSTRVAEFSQHITRSNLPPQHNIFGLIDRNGTWYGIDDSAPLLGFDAPNNENEGGAGVAAELIGAVGEPFGLRGGMALTVAVDGGLPAMVTFGRRSFPDIGAATAAQVATVLDAQIDGLRADDAAGTVRLRSHRTDEGSRIEVMPAGPTLISLDGAPHGRLSTSIDGQQRLWLAHATTVGPVANAPPRILVKSHLRGAWRDTVDVDTDGGTAQASPALVTLAGDQLWLAWVDHAWTDHTELRWRTGVPRAMTPARVLGELPGPFSLTAGTRMVLTGHGAPETFIINAADYAVLNSATALEVATAITAQLAGVSAGVAANGALALQTADAGPGIELRVDLAASTAARVLGFGDRALAGHGGWDHVVTWGPSMPVTSVASGRHSDCTATVDPEGALRLFWSTHRDARWRIARTRWDDRVLAATTLGLGIRAPGGTWSTLASADGLPDDDVRGVAVDADGSTWYATAAGGAVRTPDGTIVILDNAGTGGGLASDDVRAVAVSPNGSAWFAHPAGISVLNTGGAWQTFDITTPNQIVSNDVRHVCAGQDGSVWFSTAGGLSRRDVLGRWRTWQVAQGLPSDDVRHVSIAPDGSAWVATAAGIAKLDSDGAVESFSLVTLGGPAGADDVRAVIQVHVAAGWPAAARGSVWAATAAGVMELRARRRVVAFGLPDGLPSIDCRAVLETPDGAIWAGTAAGLARLAPGGSWTTLTTADGLPSNSVQALHGPWAAPLEFDTTLGGDSQPHAVRQGNLIWLTWAERQAIGDDSDTWLLRTRRFNFPGPFWGPVLNLTAVPPALRVTDREPHLLPQAAGGARIYFRSDRAGGPSLWSLDVSPADVVAAPVQVTTEDAGDFSPAAVRWPDGTDWLLFASDRSVPLGRLGGGIPKLEGPGDESRRAADEASLRRFAGSTTVSLADVQRNSGRRRFRDLLTYTPQKPGGMREGRLTPDEIYTRGTIGLYVERGPGGKPLTLSDAQRLRQLLDRFMPVNLRAVIVLRPMDVLLERVYPPGPTDSYTDVYPFVEVFIGPVDSTGVVLPDWLLFMSTDAGSLTADPGDLTTMRRRTFQPPPV